MDMIEQLRDYICDELSWHGRREQLTADYPLLESGVLDSLGIFQIVSFLEERCGVDVADDDLVPHNFGTLEAIVRLARSGSDESADLHGA